MASKTWIKPGWQYNIKVLMQAVSWTHLNKKKIGLLYLLPELIWNIKVPKFVIFLDFKYCPLGLEKINIAVNSVNGLVQSCFSEATQHTLRNLRITLPTIHLLDWISSTLWPPVQWIVRQIMLPDCHARKPALRFPDCQVRFTTNCAIGAYHH